MSRYVFKAGFLENFIDELCHKYLDMPAAATWGEWRIWEEEQREKHPFLFFLLKDIPGFFSRRWFGIRQTIYHLKVKYIRKYHHIKIDVRRFLGPELYNYHWYDTDTKILYGCFQTLVDFIEEEKAGEMLDWSVTPEHVKVWKEVNELYDWWIKVRPNRDPGYPKEKDYGLKEGEGFDKDTRQSKEYLKAFDKVRERENEFENEDTEMLIRLVSIRKWLWT